MRNDDPPSDSKASAGTISASTLGGSSCSLTAHGWPNSGIATERTHPLRNTVRKAKGVSPMFFDFFCEKLSEYLPCRKGSMLDQAKSLPVLAKTEPLYAPSFDTMTSGGAAISARSRPAAVAAIPRSDPACRMRTCRAVLSGSALQKVGAPNPASQSQTSISKRALLRTDQLARNDYRPASVESAALRLPEPSRGVRAASIRIVNCFWAT